MSDLFRKGYDDKIANLLALIRIARAISNKFKFVRFNNPSPTSPTLLLKNDRNETLTLQYNNNGEIEAIITKGLVRKDGKLHRRTIIIRSKLSYDLAKYLSKLRKRFWLRKPKVEIEERLTPIESKKTPVRRCKPIVPFEMPKIPKELEERAKRAFDTIIIKGDYKKAKQILEGKEPKKPIPKVSELKVPILKKGRGIPLGLIQAYIRSKLEGWLLDEYDMERFVQKSLQIWKVPTKQIEEWIKRIDDVLQTTQVGFRFIYGYIVAMRKGLVKQFIQQSTKEFDATEEQVKQLIDEVEKLLEKLRMENKLGNPTNNPTNKDTIRQIVGYSRQIRDVMAEAMLTRKKVGLRK
jgi:hypothetical protein